MSGVTRGNIVINTMDTGSLKEEAELILEHINYSCRALKKVGQMSNYFLICQMPHHFCQNNWETVIKDNE